MASEQEIIDAIEKLLDALGDYPIWTVGITEDPKRCRSQQDVCRPGWHHWDAESESAARNIKKYFLDKGMKRDTGDEDNPTYVYIF